MSYYDLHQKLEASAAATVTAAAITGLNVYTGEDNDTMKLPKVICTAPTSRESIPGSGNHWMDLLVAVESNADDTALNTHRGYVAAVFDLFKDSAIAATLTTNGTNLHVQGVLENGITSTQVDRRWRVEMALTVYCFPS